MVYGIPLATNFREVLLGRAKRVRSVLPRTDEASAALVAFWSRRWLAPRVGNPTVREAVRGHTLLNPVTHGARVQLPTLAGYDGPLFTFDEPEPLSDDAAAVVLSRAVGA